MKLATIVERLLAGLGDLPGTEAQLAMAPRPRYGWTPGHIPDEHRQGAGLLPLYEADDGVHIVLTERHHRLAKHPGQVSLPGGAVDAGETLEQAALREADEEVGIDPGEVAVLGPLTPLHIPVSGFVLYPVVGALRSVPRLRRQETEVERILDFPLTYFDAPTYGLERRTFREREIEVPYFLLPGEARLWGATAMIVAEFLALIDRRPDPWTALADDD